jgi:F0F1-type ATP synthase membrane subunit b/b'
MSYNAGDIIYQLISIFMVIGIFVLLYVLIKTFKNKQKSSESRLESIEKKLDELLKNK